MTSYDTAIFFADRLNRARALTDEESDRLQALVPYQPGRPFTADDDRRIVTMTKQGQTAAMIARELDRTPLSIHSRVKRLRRKGRL